MDLSSSMESLVGRPTVAEIDLAALRANYFALSKLVNGADLMAVVKADAYGHGAVQVARALAAEGCGHFGVATVEEGRELREASIRGRIYAMGGFFEHQAAEIAALDLTPLAFDLASIAALDKAAAGHGRGVFRIHLKIDSGASRLGLRLEDLNAAIAELRRSHSLQLEGLCTLLANAGDPTSPTNDQQLKRFASALERLRAEGFAVPVVHVANSAALVLRKDSHFNMVRPGLAIYGLPPVPAVRDLVELQPVMTFKTRLLQVKRVPAGTGVSYGHTFVTSRDSAIGVLPVGYADGYRRGLQHGGEVLIRGRRAPVVGAVCMDLTMVDLTDVPGAAPGDEVVLWGRSGDETISVNDVARVVQTISYEMLCTVGKRVPRIHRS
ncbi:MAG: alanine racemase [Candidatus Binataceae bacterium]